MVEEKVCKLLFVDDEEGIVDFCKKLYSRKGFEVFTATDGVTAVEIFQKEQPRVSLIDVHMPFSPIDGIETVAKIREIDPKAICVMVSRVSEEKDIQRAKDAGAKAYLLKPVVMEDIDKILTEVANIAFDAEGKVVI